MIRRAVRRLSGRTRKALIAGVVGLLLLWMLARAGPALVVHHPVDSPDAIISLASHEWERLPVAARRALTHPGATVVLTEPPTVTPFNCHDCAHRIERLRALGIDDSRVRVVRLTSDGTHGEALAALGYARRTGLRRLLIVTSPYHTRRSLAVFMRVFEGTGVEIGVEPALTHSVARPERWWFGGYDRSYVAYEWAALTYYLWRYDI